MCVAARSFSTLYAGQVIMEAQTLAEKYLKLKSHKLQAASVTVSPRDDRMNLERGKL